MHRRSPPSTSTKPFLLDPSPSVELCRIPQPPLTTYTTWDREESEAESYDEYDIQDFNKDEIERYNRVASPASRLKRKARVLNDRDHVAHGMVPISVPLLLCDC